MTKALLTTHGRRSSLGLVAARASQAARADVGAIFIRDAIGDDVILSPARRLSAAGLAALGSTSPLAAGLLRNPLTRPRLIYLEDGRLGTAMLWGVYGSKHAHGVLLVARRREAQPYSESDLPLLAPFAIEAGLAVMFTEARHDLERGLLAQDRNRIARELHDGVIQSLYGIGMVLAGVKAQTFQPPTHDQLSAMTESLNGVIDDIRAYIHDLTPPRLASRGLGPELCSLASEFEASSGVITSVRLNDGVDEIQTAMGRDLVQIAREALYNVAKHAAASRVVVSLRCTAQSIRLEISDDGRGITRKQRSSIRGLANIVRRAEAWGGTAEISATGGNGTLVRVLLPAHAAAIALSAIAVAV
ncbi:MAG TPA: histidine kinase [Candidatus Nitrosopolaris sp.]|nr:histidine kinase [Candidatus Nitrosopolaris sp.]